MSSDLLWKNIQVLRQCKGTNAKKETLRILDSLLMRHVLNHTYNPFLHYGITVPQTWISAGNYEFDQTTAELLRYLSTGGLSGNEAKKRVRDHLYHLTYASGQLFRCILNKSLDIGLAAKSINEVFPDLIPVHAIQLAKPVDWKRVTFPCYISPKLDGLRAIYRGGEFYSRKGHKLEGLGKLSEDVHHCFKGRTLDGELMVPGVHFNEISGKIRSFKETPDAVYRVFDLPDYNAPFYKRYADLKEIRENNDPGDLYPQVRVVHHGTVSCREAAELVYDGFRGIGYEGAMLKLMDGLYENSRTWAWQKMKNTDTADCKVVGVFEGQGKYAGIVGGLYVDFNGARVGVGSGLTDYQRNAWADDPEEIVGKTIEVAYQEVTPDGSLRHPRFVQIRGDL